MARPRVGIWEGQEACVSASFLGSSRYFRQQCATLLLCSLGPTPSVHCARLPVTGALGEKKPKAGSSRARVIRSRHAPLPEEQLGLCSCSSAGSEGLDLSPRGRGRGVSCLPQQVHLPSWVSAVLGLKAFPKRQGWGSFSLQQVSNRFGHIVCA